VKPAGVGCMPWGAGYSGATGSCGSAGLKWSAPTEGLVARSPTAPRLQPRPQAAGDAVWRRWRRQRSEEDLRHPGLRRQRLWAAQRRCSPDCTLPRPVPPSLAAGGALLSVAAEAEVVVRHLIKGTELSVVLPRDATFYELKKAVSMRVGREEFLKRARLACKQSGQLLPCQDSSVVGDVREVIVIGASLEVHHDEQALSPGAARLERTAGAPAEGDRRGRPSPR